MKKKFCIFFIFFIIILFIIFVCSYSYKLKNDDKKDNISKLDNEFVINKVQFYSSANAISNTTNYQNPEWNLKVYQYTDIAIYFDRLNEEIKENNYITSISLSNFKLENPEKEEVYYINPKIFGKNTLELDTKIDDKLEYIVINDDNSDNDQTYNIPIYFQDCSNPITLRYINYLSDNYKVTKDETLKYNGSLISKLGFNIEDLNNKLNFDLQIITKDETKRVKNISLEIPYEDKEKSILEGDFETKIKKEIEF